MKESKKPCLLDWINTSIGKKWLVVTYTISKEFKILKGAENWIEKNNYKVVKKLDLD